MVAVAKIYDMVVGLQTVLLLLLLLDTALVCECGLPSITVNDGRRKKKKKKRRDRKASSNFSSCLFYLFVVVASFACFPPAADVDDCTAAIRRQFARIFSV